MKVVHVTQCFSRGGAGRALLAVADESSTIVSLTPPDALMRERARAPVTHDTVVLERADVVLLHFWNTPELYALVRGGLPPVRIATWWLVDATTPPHVVTDEVRAFSDVLVGTAPGLDRVIQAAPDLSRLVEPRAHDGFVVGYVGSLDEGKLHPRFAKLCAAVRGDARFVVCGTGATLEGERLDVRGYVEDIGPVLAGLDVFGYPAAPGSYATADLALQEAMAAGVPPVVLAGSGPAALVEHGVTGLVARDEDDYVRAIEYLRDNPAERRRLGRNARSRPLSDPAAEWAAVLTELLEQPKRAHAPRPLRGADALVASLGGIEPDLSQPAVAHAVLHYRQHYPDDPRLQAWAGTVLDAAGKHALAAAARAGLR